MRETRDIDPRFALMALPRCGATIDPVTNVLRAGALPRFADPREAGVLLAARLSAYTDVQPVVVGIAPEGMPVAAEIARALEAPLEALAVQPLSFDGAGAARFGTAAEGGIVFFDPEHRDEVDSEPEDVDAILLDAEAGFQQHAATWHERNRRQSLRGRHVLLVAELLGDHQIAAAAACAVRDRGAAEVVFVTPQAELAAALASVEWMDEIVCLELSDHELSPVDCFEQRPAVSDQAIRALLHENRSDCRRARRPRA